MHYLYKLTDKCTKSAKTVSRPATPPWTRRTCQSRTWPLLSASPSKLLRKPARRRPSIASHSLANNLFTQPTPDNPWINTISKPTLSLSKLSPKAITISSSLTPLRITFNRQQQTAEESTTGQLMTTDNLWNRRTSKCHRCTRKSIRWTPPSGCWRSKLRASSRRTQSWASIRPISRRCLKTKTRSLKN